MKISILALFLVLFASVVFASTAFVASYENKKGTVTFNHEVHSAQNECSVCHEGTPATIEIDKTFAHKTCKGCHNDTAGPTKCNGCHVK